MINTVMHAFLAWPKNTYPFNHPHDVPLHTAFEINEIMEEKRTLTSQQLYKYFNVFAEQKAIHKAQMGLTDSSTSECDD